jgi:hypothetical protein
VLSDVLLHCRHLRSCDIARSPSNIELERA